MVIYNLLLLHCLFIIIIIYQLLLHTVYAVAGNFRGAKFSWFSWLEVWPRIFYPRMKRPCLPLPTIQAATTKILSTKCLNIAEPRIFCPPKITHLYGSLLIIIALSVNSWGWLYLEQVSLSGWYLPLHQTTLVLSPKNMFSKNTSSISR